MSDGALCLKKAAANGLIILKETVLNPFESIFVSVTKSGHGCSLENMYETVRPLGRAVFSCLKGGGNMGEYWRLKTGRSSAASKKLDSISWESSFFAGKGAIIVYSFAI